MIGSSGVFVIFGEKLFWLAEVNSRAGLYWGIVNSPQERM